MIHKFLSIRPTIFGGVIAFAALSLAACSPVAIMMPQAGEMINLPCQIKVRLVSGK